MIQFTKDINENALRMAFNNDVLEFYEDAEINTYADVIMTGATLRLYPSPSGKFWVNLMPIVSALINENKFNDTITPEIDELDANSLLYTWADALLSREVTLSIYCEPATTTYVYPYNLKWLAGVQQLGNNIPLLKTDVVMLTPFTSEPQNHRYIKYWEGYPFDIGIYSPEASLNIMNRTNLQDLDLTLPAESSRLFLCDGNIDVTIDDFLPLVLGINNLEFTFGENVEYVALNKADFTCGVYLKWLNNLGGYSYWLFENTYAIDRNYKSTGTLQKDIANLDYTTGIEDNISIESTEKYALVTEILSPEEIKIVSGIFDSPKVYLFVGTPQGQSDTTDWVQISVAGSTSRIKNYKGKQNVISVTAELPQRYTQTL